MPQNLEQLVDRVNYRVGHELKPEYEKIVNDLRLRQYFDIDKAYVDLQAENNRRATVTCKYTKYVRIMPGREDWSAEDWAKAFFSQVVRHHQLPRVIVSDRDAKFTGKFWRGLLQKCRMQGHLTAAYHPAADGQPGYEIVDMGYGTAGWSWNIGNITITKETELVEIAAVTAEDIRTVDVIWHGLRTLNEGIGQMGRRAYFRSNYPNLLETHVWTSSGLRKLFGDRQIASRWWLDAVHVIDNIEEAEMEPNEHDGTSLAARANEQTWKFKVKGPKTPDAPATPQASVTQTPTSAAVRRGKCLSGIFTTALTMMTAIWRHCIVIQK